MATHIANRSQCPLGIDTYTEGIMDEQEHPTYSTQEVATLTGVSYRMLDYWLRQGIIAIDGDAIGSGSRRRWSCDEVTRLQRCLDQVKVANETIDAWSSGVLWKAASQTGDLQDAAAVR